LKTIIIKGKFDHRSCIDNSSSMTFERFCETNDSFLKKGFVEWFVYGNVNKESAL